MTPSDTARLFTDDIHPRLFFGPDDIPALREKADREPCRLIRDEILKRAKDALTPGTDCYVDPSWDKAEMLKGFGGGQINGTGLAMHYLAFAYVLTGDDTWADEAIRIVMQFTNSSLSIDAAIENPEMAFESICHETFANNLTFVFDFCYERFSEEDRTTVHAYLRAVCEGYRKQFLYNPRGHKFGLGNNTFWRTFEKYVVTTAATWKPGEDGPELANIEGFLRRSIHRGVDEGGAIYEGPGYGWRDTEWLSYTAEVLRRMGAIDLWKDEPRFARIFEHWACLILPANRGQNNYCDAHRHKPDRPMVGMLLAARRLNEPVFQWVWEQLGGRGNPLGLGNAPTWFRWGLGQSLLWEEPEAEAKDPGSAGWPSSRTSGNAGVMVMRSAWDNDSLYASLLASTRYSGNNIHQQVDSGHFSLFALGEAFSVDSGYGDILGRYHSLMMPNGQEPIRAPHVFTHMFFGGRPEAFASDTYADYGRVNTGEQWNCHWAYRHMMLVKMPGVRPYLIVFDDMNVNPEHRMYRWQMNSEPGNVVEIDDAQERATITGKKNRLELAWSYPAKDTYPKDHWLELSATEIESFNWMAKHKPTGMGKRPQLRADLWGYNGELLSVLMPRLADEQSVPAERIFGTDQFGLVLDFGDFTDTVVASPVERRVDIGGMNGEASLAVVRRNTDGKCTCWAAADAFSMQIDGETKLDHTTDPLTLATATVS